MNKFLEMFELLPANPMSEISIAFSVLKSLFRNSKLISASSMDTYGVSV
jgi:hypothetical protein